MFTGALDLYTRVSPFVKVQCQCCKLGVQQFVPAVYPRDCDSGGVHKSGGGDELPNVSDSVALTSGTRLLPFGTRRPEIGAARGHGTVLAADIAVESVEVTTATPGHGEQIASDTKAAVWRLSDTAGFPLSPRQAVEIANHAAPRHGLGPISLDHIL